MTLIINGGGKILMLFELAAVTVIKYFMLSLEHMLLTISRSNSTSHIFQKELIYTISRGSLARQQHLYPVYSNSREARRIICALL